MMEIRFGTYLPTSFHAEEGQSASPTRVAVVGTGLWAREHARAYAASPIADLVGLRGRDPARVEQRAAEYGARPYTDLTEMLEKEQPEVVSICVENRAHYETTRAVLEAGFPAIVEKPFVIELDEARALLELAEQRGLFFAIVFNHRYAEPALRTKALLEEGALGDIVFASWRFSGNHDYEFDHPHIQLIETDCHGIDLLQHTVGEIESVSAEMTDKTGKKGFGTLVLALRFVNGAVGSILASYDSSYAYPAANTLEINGRLGRVVTEDTVKRMVFNRVDDPVAQVWQSSYFDDEGRYFAGTLDRYIADTLGAFRRGAPPPVPARRGYDVLRVSYAAIRSFESGRRVAVRDVT